MLTKRSFGRKYLLKECPGYDQIYSLSRESSGFCLLKRKKPGDCVICQRNHDKSNAYIFIKGPMQNLLLGCYRSREFKLLASMKPKCKGDYEEPEEVITEGILIKDQKYILPLSIEDKVQVIVAPMGMGKMHALVEFLKKQDHKVQILCLSPRISYSDATYGRFGDARLEFEHYLGAYINKLYKSECLIFQMESLYKISEDYKIKGKKGTYDILVLDEMSSLMNQFFSSTMDEYMHVNFETFVRLIQDTDQVIVVDALLHKVELDMIKI